VIWQNLIPEAGVETACGADPAMVPAGLQCERLQWEACSATKPVLFGCVQKVPECGPS